MTDLPDRLAVKRDVEDTLPVFPDSNAALLAL
jgi:hypothetical protein